MKVYEQSLTARSAAVKGLWINASSADTARKMPKNFQNPEWYAFVTNMSLTKDGAELVHEVSKPYPRYSKTETDDKIRHAINEHKPHTCRYIQERLGFKNCKDCSVKAPVAYAVLSMAEQAEDLAGSDISEDMIF